MSKTLLNRAHVTETFLAFAAKNTSACIQGISGGNFGGGGATTPTFRKIGSLSGIFGFVGILNAIEYTET